MIGSNVLTLNQATACAAIAHWMNCKQLASGVRVKVSDVKAAGNYGRSELLVTFQPDDLVPPSDGA